jgi:glycosidase
MVVTYPEYGKYYYESFFSDLIFDIVTHYNFKCPTSLKMQNTVSGTDVIDAKQVKIEYGLQQDFRNLVAAAKEMGTYQILN